MYIDSALSFIITFIYISNLFSTRTMYQRVKLECATYIWDAGFRHVQYCVYANVLRNTGGKESEIRQVEHQELSQKSVFSSIKWSSFARWCSFLLTLSFFLFSLLRSLAKAAAINFKTRQQRVYPSIILFLFSCSVFPKAAERESDNERERWRWEDKLPFQPWNPSEMSRTCSAWGCVSLFPR